MAIDLFPLLHNRMARENQVVPQFLGEFHGVNSLPKGVYPAIYYWVNTAQANAVCLSLNGPLLERWCIEEARAVGVTLDADCVEIQRAMSLLQQVSSRALQKMLA
jgi:hypothetical protein